MSHLRLPLRLYVSGVIGASTLALAAAAAASPAPTPAHLVLFAVLLGLASVAQLWPVHISPKYKFTVEDVATFCAALLLSPALAMLVGGGSTLIASRFGTRYRWYNRLFNASVGVLGTGAAAFVFGGLAGGGPITRNPAAVLAAAIAMYLVQATCVDLAVSLQLRREPFSVWWMMHRREIGQTTALYALGTLAALSVTTQPWALVLFAVPTGAVLFTLKESARLREQTKRTILELADLVDMRDPYTHGHSERVSALAERLARQMKLSGAQIELVREAGRLHDIGKIGTDDHVLQKPGPLEAHEFAAMRKHSEFGAKLLRTLPEFWEGAELVLAHHERFDGSGYPRGLKGDELPMEASIIAVADAYDAMASDRPYRKALPWEHVRAELLRGRGTHWDSRVVETFVEMLDEEQRVALPRAREAAATTA